MVGIVKRIDKEIQEELLFVQRISSVVGTKRRMYTVETFSCWQVEQNRHCGLRLLLVHRRSSVVRGWIGCQNTRHTRR
jgi:hypothetical protein